MDRTLENDPYSRPCESDDSGDESNGSDWYLKEDDGLDEDDKELIENTCEKTFGFETDHMALKGNLDYHNLIKTLALLEAQRIKTIEDIDKLEKLKHTIKDNPREYLNKFLSGDTSDIPSRIKIAPVPDIDWSKYSSKRSCRDVTIKKTSPTGSSVEDDATNDVVEDGLDKMTVRGRVYDQSKPQTFNQLWTAEEQLRLEELLVEYPSEKNENNRWRKIARALGNRTTKQVCSRVQKYFKKLNKAGLPIPGNNVKTNNIALCKKKRRKKIPADKSSTFFPTNHLGVAQLFDGCEEEDLKSGMSVLNSEMKAEIIHKVLEFKKKDAQVSDYSHPGVKCAACDEAPLMGTRWRCLVCPGVSLCSDCVIDQLNCEPHVHSPSHPLEPCSNPSLTHWDPDYTPDSFQSNNYLDPNFITGNVV